MRFDVDTNKYVSLIKEIIAAQVKKVPLKTRLTPKYFEKLFSEIEVKIRSAASIIEYPSVDNVTLKNYYEVAKREYLSVNPIDIEPASLLTKDGFETWLNSDKVSEIQWNYAERYFSYLEGFGRSETVVEETRVSSLSIMEKLGDPKSSDEFYVKGLVVGEVQSGKTGNFNAVINRSIDCGYGLIIVLSGIMEDLRSQTQQRIDCDVVGEGVDIETKKFGRKGVGSISTFGKFGGSQVEQVVSVTSCKSDFNKSLADADFSLNHTNVIVCKKNNNVLKNLIVWLHDYLDQDKEKHNIPLLILDDEADNASLNNEGANGREYASKINGHIRALLQLFHKKTYLGYTATPFANVLQDRNDCPENDWIIRYKLKGETEEKSLPQVSNIFPDDFIVLLSTPSNYIGAKQIFETVKSFDEDILENKQLEKLPLVHVVSDNIENYPARVWQMNDGDLIGVENFTSKKEWNEKVGKFNSYSDFDNYRDYKERTRSGRTSDDFPKNIPQSLEDAILCFLLSIAVRESRKPMMIKSTLYQPHNTMLIHISRFTSWQNKTCRLIKEYVAKLSSSIDNDNPESTDSIYFELANIWYRYYATIIESIMEYLPFDYVDDFMTPIAFDSLKRHLPKAIKGLEVRAINSVTKVKLEYANNDPKKIIAIGGNRLSRGFTLEGLTINYFVRSTNYSDTLLQMGRWFGYRPGYLDCCKIFTTQESIDKFDSTTKCIEELEIEFRKMEKLNKSPEKFVLRVKKHPGTLKITRPSILKNTVDVKWSYQDQLEMTTEFDVRKEKIEKVWSVFRNEIAPLFKVKEDNPRGFITYTTSGKGIVELLKKENNFLESDLHLMIKFIELCNNRKKLTNWTVAVKTHGAAKKKYGKGILEPEESKLPKRINLAVRSGPGLRQESVRQLFLNSKRFKATGRSANIVSTGKDLSILLSDSEIKEAEEEFRVAKAKYFLVNDKALTDDAAKERASGINIPERVYREKMKENEGLLIIYLFDSYYSFNQRKGKEDAPFKKLVDNENYDLDIPIIGYAIGFPPIENDPGGEYVKGDYDLDCDEAQYEEECSDEDVGLPMDFREN